MLSLPCTLRIMTFTGLNIMDQGQIQDFLKGGSENLKKGVWSTSPEAREICIVKHQNHTLRAYV